MSDVHRDDADLEGASLHISNLTRNVKEEHLEEIFGTYGEVQKVKIERDSRSGLTKGFASVSFVDTKAAEQAVLYLDGGQIDGQNIKVSFVLVSNKRKRDTEDRRSSPSPRRYKQDDTQRPFNRDNRDDNMNRTRPSFRGSDSGRGGGGRGRGGNFSRFDSRDRNRPPPMKRSPPRRRSSPIRRRSPVGRRYSRDRSPPSSSYRRSSRSPSYDRNRGRRSLSRSEDRGSDRDRRRSRSRSRSYSTRSSSPRRSRSGSSRSRSASSSSSGSSSNSSRSSKS